MSPSVSVNELKIGMYVHLDLSWMSHPFPRSSFKIETPQQIQTIQGLGLKQVRWDPQRSDRPAEPVAVAAPAPAPVDTPVAPAIEPAVAMTPQEQTALERRKALAQQRAAAELCESQYQEASAAWTQAFERVATEPVLARGEAEALSQALLDKMLVEGEMCIRVLNAASGDRATAHAMNVAVISMLMGRMLGIESAELAELGTGALLHDVGKLAIPERLRHPDDRFAPAELAAYAEHVEQGAAQARRMGLGALASAIIVQHHEHADGSGFPRRLSGEGISMPARIVALVNRFDNLCNPPSLSRAMTPHEALSTLFAHSRSKFDATVLNAFIRMMGVYPAGSVVQLTDDRYAMVMSVNSVRPLKPRVLVYDQQVPRDEALHLDLETTPDLGIRRSIRALQLPAAALDYLAPRPRVAYFFEPGARAPFEEAAVSH